MVLTRAVDGAGGVRGAFWGAGCGGRVRRFQTVGSREVGAEAWGRVGQCSHKVGLAALWPFWQL